MSIQLFVRLGVLAFTLAGCDGLESSKKVDLRTKDADLVGVDSSDTLAPAAPTAFTATARGAFQISLQWVAAVDDRPAGIRKYEIFRNGAFLAEIDGDLTDYSDGGLTKLTSYEYYIIAVDSGDNRSPPSETATASTTDLTGADLYAMHCSGCHGDLGQTEKLNRTVADINAAINNLAVMAYLGESLNPQIISAIADALSTTKPDNIPPAALTGLSGVALGPTSVSLSWKAGEDNIGGSGVAGYRIFRNGQALVDIADSTVTYADTGLTPSQVYNYHGVVLDKAGNSSAKSSTISVKTLAPFDGDDTLAPSVPKNFQLLGVSPTRVKLSWEHSVDAGSGVKGYTVYRNGVRITDVFAAYNTFEDIELAANQTYKYAISAFDHMDNMSAKTADSEIKTESADGSKIYHANCFSCHGELATSTKRGRSLATIASAIKTVGTMQILSILGQDELAAVATALSDSDDNTAPTKPSAFTAVARSQSEIELTWAASTDAGSGVKEYRLYRDSVFMTKIPSSALLAKDSGRTADTLYKYEIEAVDISGNVSTKAATQVRTPKEPVGPDNTPPTIPGNFSGTADTYDSITLTWSASSDAGSGVAGYRILKNGMALPDLGAASTSYKDEGLNPSTVYQYQIKAIDGAMNSSLMSNTIEVETPALMGSVAYGRHCLSCHGAIETTSKRTKTANQIKVAIQSVGDMQSLSTLSDSVIASIADALVDKNAPLVPAGLTVASISDSVLALSWTASTDTGGSGLKGYRIFRNGTMVHSTTSSVLSWNDNDLEPETTYNYALTAFDVAGNTSAKSGNVAGTTKKVPLIPDVTKPSIPGNLRATAAIGVITLNWNASTDTGGSNDSGSGIKSYRITRNDSVRFDVSGVVLTYTDRTVAPSTAYTYRIQAIDGKDNLSDFSAALAVTSKALDGVLIYNNNCLSCHGAIETTVKRTSTAAIIKGAIRTVTSMKSLILTDNEINAVVSALADKTAPTVPSNLKATVVSDKVIGLSWNASTDAGGSNHKEYKIFRGGTLIATLGSDKLSFTNDMLTAETTYSYQISATDNAGNESAKSTVVTAKTKPAPATPDTTPPSVPTGLSASATYKQIVVRWSASTDTGGSAGGSGIKTYKLMRNDGVVKSISSPTLTFTDLAVEPAKAYTFKVLAVDGSNNESAYSAAFPITTPAPDGILLYAANCASCHEPIAVSKKRTRTAAVISSAIQTVPEMRGLSVLKAPEVAAIALALADKTAPSVPKALSGVSTPSQVTLTWGQSTDTGGSGLKHYKVFRNNVEIKTVTAPSTSVNDTGLTEKTTYTYTVLAIDNANNQSPKSTALTIATKAIPPKPDTVAPTVPASVSATAKSYKSVEIKWAASTDTGGSGLSGYRVYRNNVFVKTVATTSYIDGNLTANKAYNYNISAIDGSANESAKSLTAPATTPAINGARIYADNCASCHGGLADSAKSGAASSEIRYALTNIVSMKAIVLDDQQIAAVSEALRPVVPPVAGRSEQFSYIHPSGTRFFLKHKLESLFLPASGALTSSDTPISTTIRDLVERQPGAFGGPCGRNDKLCYGEGLLPVTLSAPMLPSPSPVRSGYLIRVCSEILQRDRAVVNVLGRAALTTASAGNAANIKALYALFKTGGTPSTDSVNALVNLHKAAITKQMSSVDAWRYVTKAVCEAPNADAF